MSNDTELTSTQELAERYVDRLRVQSELLKVLESTLQAMSRVDNEIKSITEMLESRNVEIKSIEDR